jgi:hypothetical protein
MPPGKFRIPACRSKTSATEHFTRRQEQIMNFLSLLSRAAITCALCATSACTQSAASSNAAETGAAGTQSHGSAWVTHGATACDTYFTPDFVGQIFSSSAGHSKKLSSQACSFDSPSGLINITLVAAGPADFEAHLAYQTNPVSLPDVGDKAVRSLTGIEAVKGDDRMCSIDVMSSRLSGEQLAQKLGEVCNKLFALP